MKRIKNLYELLRDGATIEFFREKNTWSTIQVKHAYLRHMNERRLLKLYKHQFLNGIKSCKFDFYKHYIFKKNYKMSFNTIIHWTKYILDYIYLNI